MTESPSQPSFNERFDNLLIAPARVMKMIGKRGPGEVLFEESEQGDARRQLLNVEKVAIKNKELQAKHDASYLDSVRYDLHEQLLTDLHAELENSENVYRRTLSLSEDTPAMLDVMSVKATSVSKIEPFAAAQPWLYDELMQVVNSPTHRRRDSKGRVIVVESMRTALSFLGIENLRVLLPALVLRRAIPQITDPYPLIKHQLLNYAYGTAVTARELSRFGSIRPTEAYTLGMLSNLGRCAIIRLYFRLFDQVQRRMLEEAQSNRQRDLHDALLKLRPSANYLIALQNEYAEKVTADIFEHMHFKRLGIAEAMRTIATDGESTPGSLVELLRQSRLYTQVRMAHRSKVLEKDEIKDAIRQQPKYPSGSLEVLRGVNIFQLPVTSNTEDA
ncbi:HDOD domain-containing protein [Alteromonas sp. ASW11-19]|uniref:HDOD domain-containing protein n=1 Tax=Alteromonas salexigens TaxID=2982530 RepID=A0ABT2VJF7_9ALTE|nr:HDOD domain-containing protein [Alteromonas salexigens]MCU7553326.1 HDOD domain-containing protein [Alteromonas salexigens]